MQGIPKQFNTKQDIDTCVALANEEQIEKAALKMALTVLRGDQKVREISQHGVTADYVAVAGETIIEERDMLTSEITHNVLVEVENMHSRLRLVLGMTPDELNAIIGGL